MNDEVFEQLVSAWLDEPQRADLRARLEQAVAADPERARLRDEYARLEELIRQAAPDPEVDWLEFKARVVAEIDQLATESSADARLEQLLRAALPDIEQRVDWAALRGRVSQAIDRDAARAGRRRPVRRRVTIAAGFLAAAAAVVLWLSFPTAEAPVAAPAEALPHVYVEVLPPPDRVEARAELVRVTVYEDPEVAVQPAPDFVADQPLQDSDPEVYFMLEPPAATLTMATANGFGSP